MAAEDRLDVKAYLDLYIKANGNKEITGPQVNEAITKAIESAFFQINEPRTASSVNYTTVGNPADWDGGVAPATQNLVNDQLADRMTFLETNNYSQNVAYFGPTGSDALGEAELGNEAKPFLTMQAAIDAVPFQYGRVISLGGEFTENVVITKSDFNLEFKNSRLEGSLSLINCVNFSGDIGGSEIENVGAIDTITKTGGSGRQTLIGGKIMNNASTRYAIVGGNMFMVGVQIECTGNARGISLANSFLSSCEITTEQNHVIALSSNSLFLNCVLEATTSGVVYQTQAFNTFRDCEMTAVSSVVAGQSFNGLQGKFVNCKMKSTTGDVFNFNGDDKNIEVRGCTIDAATSCVVFQSFAKPANERYVFQNNKMICGSGEIFDDSLAAGAGTWQALLINNAVNKALTFTTPAYFDDFNTYTNTTLPST